MLAALLLAALTVPEPPFLVCVVLQPGGSWRRAPAPIPDSFWDTYEEAAARRRQIVTEGWIGQTADDGGEEEYGPGQIRKAVLGSRLDQRFCGGGPGVEMQPRGRPR